MAVLPLTMLDDGNGGGCAAVCGGAIPTGGIGAVEGIGGGGFCTWPLPNEPPKE